MQEFAPAIYTGALIFCTGAVILLNWDWINAMRPSVKLSALHDDIEEWVKDETAEADLDVPREINYLALRRKLERLGIKLASDRSSLRDQLPLLLLCAKESDVGLAKRLSGIWTTKTRESSDG